MAKAFLICIIKKFPQKDFLVPIQQEFDLLETEGKPVTSIQINTENFHINFDQYKCHNDYIHNKSGRVFNRDFNYYFEPLDFHSYYKKDDSLLLVQTKTDAAIDFVNRLNNTKEYDIKPVDIDFKNMIPLITEVSGAWFADLKRTHLKTAGYFGPNVNKSEEYKEAASEGNISSIHLKYISTRNNKEHYVVISKKGSVILYDTLQTPEEELDIIDEIYRELINPHL
ncbi:hypothetical protein [Virgibacillus sp. Bac330]|uniref:hypothetical protein n=1 Tax=Virgibacillus sp. Bac330 TaxID=2419841 RepID=UPI000EF45D10|nr:hypothetical protein [Virgibacillus sp. Bac330]